MIYVANRRTAYPPIDRMPSLETVVLQRRLQGKPQLHDKITLGKVDVSELLSKGKIRWAWYAEHYWRLCKQAAKKEPKSSRIQLLLDVFVELSDGHRIVVWIFLAYQKLLTFILGNFDRLREACDHPLQQLRHRSDIFGAASADVFDIDGDDRRLGTFMVLYA